MVSHICPVCGSEDVHHSHVKSFGEKLRFNLTWKVPFRCYACGWRDWLSETSSSAAPQDKVHKPPPTQAELDMLDPDLRIGSENEAPSVVGDLMSYDDEQREQKKRGA
jgi:hypothetical protein